MEISPPTTTKLTTAAATEGGLLALTTSFIPPPNRDCEINDLIDIVTSTWNNTLVNTTTRIIYSDPADPRFASCQPQGWERVVPQSRFTFSPAVCPSQWIARYIRLSSSAGKTVTTAYCCKDLYDVLKTRYTALGDEIGQCIQSFNEYGNITVLATLSHGTGAIRTITSGLIQHPAWNIIWEASDQATLTPRPPNIGSNTLVNYWVPGTPLDERLLGDQPDGLDGLATAIFWFLVIGLPLIVLSISGCCVWCCVRKRKRKRRLALTATPVGIPSS